MSVYPAQNRMEALALPTPRRRDIGDILSVGIGSTIAMVAVAYSTHVPLVPQSRGLSILAISLMLLCPVVGGFVMGRYGRRGVWGGLWAGLVAGTYALLMYSSVFHDKNVAAEIPSPALWMPGVIILHGLLGLFGAVIGKLFHTPRQLNWKAFFAIDLVVLTLLLIGAGGLVTGNRAGLAVPDWPNSFGSNMVMLPLTKMTGGIFYEHAHRLIATLVGFVCLTLAIYVSFAARRKSIIIWAWAIGLCVLTQAIMGGMRVTGSSEAVQGLRATVDLAPAPSLNPAAYQPSIGFAVAHGFFAHFILAGLITIAVLLTARWMSPLSGAAKKYATVDRTLTIALVIMVFAQVLLGVFVRQLNWFLIEHITLAVLVTLMALFVGARAWGLNSDQPLLQWLGLGVLLVVFVQLCLGLAALIVRPALGVDPRPMQALITTAHQVNGALLLSASVLLALWTWRLVRPGEVRAALSTPAEVATIEA